MLQRSVLGAFILQPLVVALDNGLGRTPPMGYNSWYDLECDRSMNETFLQAEVDALISKGLNKLGYRYFNLDDCWAIDRQGPGGALRADPSKFPSGTLKPLADHVHSKGLLFGTYTDRGDKTCAGRPAALDHEDLDAMTYASWGVDYLKEDSCFAPDEPKTAFQQYSRMRDALNKTGRPIYFSLCGWHEWYAPVGASIGNSWRIGPDDTNWNGILTNIDIMATLPQYAGPGGWNDPCLLLSSCSVEHGDCPQRRRVTELQSRAQFSMWAVLAAPLLISGSILDMSEMDYETYTNKDVIAVSQDMLGKQGVRVVGSNLTQGSINIWGRSLVDGSVAVVFINSGPLPADVTCDASCLAALGFAVNDKLQVKNLWAPWKSPEVLSGTLQATALAPDGGHMMVRVTKLSSDDFPVFM